MDTYNTGTDVNMADGILRGFTEADVWTVADNGDGTWSFSYDGKNIGMGDQFSSMPLGEKNDKWEIIELDNGQPITSATRSGAITWSGTRRKTTGVLTTL